MPCNDITDRLIIRLDPDDRVLQYSLRKKTCNGEVGEKSMIIGWAEGRSAEEILDLPVDRFLAENPMDDDIQEYLLIKHLLALRTGLGILLGRESGGKDSYCTVDSITYSPNGIQLTAELRVEGMTAEIQACGNCCGSKHS